jgi:uncharacterized protein YndB with AHSA1/START domain
MPTTSEIIIEAPRDKVWRAFFHPENAKKWLPDLIHYANTSGTPMQPGSTAKLVMLQNGRMLEMTETVLDRRDPSEFTARYDGPGFSNTVTHRFDDLGNGTTAWQIETDVRFTGLARLFGWLFVGLARRKGRADLMRFKERLEAGALAD